MSYLIDTNVVSELRKAKRCDAHVARWFAGIGDEEIFLSVLTLGELRRGIDSIERRDRKSASVLKEWFRGLVANFQEEILPVDRAIAEEWGRMNVPNRIPVVDGLLAATAQVHGLTLAARNTRDLARTGVNCINPFLV